MSRWVEASFSLAALLVAAAALTFAIISWRAEKDARLVKIGVSILRADPKKEPSAASARKWALDLIDAHAGGVKFSTVARQKLLDQALVGRFDWAWDSGNEFFVDGQKKSGAAEKSTK